MNPIPSTTMPSVQQGTHSSRLRRDLTVQTRNKENDKTSGVFSNTPKSPHTHENSATCDRCRRAAKTPPPKVEIKETRASRQRREEIARKRALSNTSPRSNPATPGREEAKTPKTQARVGQSRSTSRLNSTSPRTPKSPPSGREQKSRTPRTQRRIGASSSTSSLHSRKKSSGQAEATTPKSPPSGREQKSRTPRTQRRIGASSSSSRLNSTSPRSPKPQTGAKQTPSSSRLNGLSPRTFARATLPPGSKGKKRPGAHASRTPPNRSPRTPKGQARVTTGSRSTSRLNAQPQATRARSNSSKASKPRAINQIGRTPSGLLAASLKKEGKSAKKTKEKPAPAENFETPPPKQPTPRETPVSPKPAVSEAPPAEQPILQEPSPPLEPLVSQEQPPLPVSTEPPPIQTSPRKDTVIESMSSTNFASQLKGNAFADAILREMEATIRGTQSPPPQEIAEPAPAPVETQPEPPPPIVAQEEMELPPIVTEEPDPRKVQLQQALQRQNYLDFWALEKRILPFFKQTEPCELTPEKLNRILKKPHLTKLRSVLRDTGKFPFSKLNADAKTIAALPELPHTRLSWPCDTTSSKLLAMLPAKLPKLRDVALFYDEQVTGLGLVGFHDLTSFHFSVCGNTDPNEFVALVKRCPDLRRFEILGQYVTPALIDALSKCQSLEFLDFSYCHFDKEVELKPLYNHPKLKTLDITNANIEITEINKWINHRPLISIHLKHEMFTPPRDSSPIIHATSLIAPIPVMDERESTEEFLEVIRFEANSTKEKFQREADFLFFGKFAGQKFSWPLKAEARPAFEDALSLFKDHLIMRNIPLQEMGFYDPNPEKDPSEAARRSIYAPTQFPEDVRYWEAVIQAADNWNNLAIRMLPTHCFVEERCDANLFAILQSLTLRRRLDPPSLLLSGISLTRVPYQFYTELFPFIKKIDLSDNPLREIPEEKFFSQSHDLEELLLDDTLITSPSNLSVSCPNLKQLSMKSTKPNTAKMTQFPLRMVRGFFLEHDLRDPSEDDLSGKWTPSLVIDLRGQPIKDLPPDDALEALNIYIGKDLNTPPGQASPRRSKTNWFKRREDLPDPKVAVLIDDPDFLKKYEQLLKKLKKI